MFITDFDGVLCDSVQECLLVTYNAYHRLHAASSPRSLNLEEIDRATREQFRKLRSYLRGVEDFIPIFSAIAEQLPITNQKEFDALRSSHQDHLLTYQQAFYAERDYLLHHEKGLWLSLNPLFDGIREALRQCASFEQIQILTTKRQEDVLEIFQYQGIPFPTDHVTYIKAAGKSQKLLELLQTNNAALPESVYVEDQVDFLIEAQKHRIGSYLVEWGYVSDEQKALARRHAIPIIGVEKFSNLLERFQ